MPSDQDQSSTVNKSIPLLDSTNFNEWYLRIQLFLKHKTLLQYCLEPINPNLSGAAESNTINKATEAALILINHISSEAFDAVISVEKSEDPY